VGVKAPKFSYARPDTLAEALALLAEHGEEARILAGGQSLMPTLNMRLSQPRVLVDINRIAELAGITLEDGHVRIGALTRHAEVAASPVVSRHLPLIAEAMPHVAHVAVRNRGTFGGSMALADPAAEMPACALALGATLVLASVRGRREVPAEAFFRGLYATARQPDEILVEARIPVGQPGSVAVFLELARRHGDFALAGLAFQLMMERDVVTGGRLVYFASEDRPTLSPSVLDAIQGRRLNGGVIADAAAALRELAPMSNPHGSAKLRLHLQRVLTRRALQRLCARSEAA
jgi:carbon-monoxide dehydrogenase medium subunit